MESFSVKVEEEIEEKPLHLKVVLIKEEPEDQSFVKQEEEQLPQFTAVCVKSEESSLSDVQIQCSPELSLKQEIPETPQIKEELEEHSCAKQEEVQLPQFTEISPKTDNIIITKVVSLCDVRETHNHSAEESEEQTDNSPDTDNEDDWEPPASTSTSQMETKTGDHYNHVQRKKHECTVCMKRFRTKQNLTTHTRTHTGEKPYSCPTCQKAFADRSTLRLHKRLHTGEKPYSCSICNKAFSQKSNLGLHMKIHLGEKPFKCSFCSKTFLHKSHLQDHVKTHTGEKPYSCSVCEKTFISKSNLKIHERFHTGEKPHSCSVCLKTFVHTGNLIEHMRTHTGERPYSCTTCQQSFALKCTLVEHVRRIHKRGTLEQRSSGAT